ncbi:MAG TPA: hypothetical protein VMR70_21415 [Flavisolibacter sp.]|nr:hypothetical protein [Flavisolibacter sp.]
MFEVNTHLKVSFGDWLYMLGYELNIGSQPIMQHAQFFEKAKTARFRFENTALHTEREEIDTSFQYGNYHLSKLTFDDFLPTSVRDVQRAIEMLIRDEKAVKIGDEERNAAIRVIEHNLTWLLAGASDVYKLGVGSIEMEHKKAPFATHPLFSSFLAFSKNKGKVVYLEFGSD